jgi:hypothetical protein
MTMPSRPPPGGQCEQVVAAAAPRQYRSAKRTESLGRFRRMLISLLFSTVLPRGNHMNWFYWDTAWSLFFSVIWFMTITHNPDAQIADAHLRDEAFGG